MGFLTEATGIIAPIFIVMSPILSYSDQAISMHRTKTSAGFSLDIPLIMLVASILKIFYWPGAQFESSLLLQALIMVVMQLALLKIALDHRPPPSAKGGDGAVPFAGAEEPAWMSQRPYNFWQWRSHKPYWHFLLYLVAGLFVLQFLLSPWQGVYSSYSNLLGYLGLGIEAMLPIPQILANSRARSCKGFRFSILASWILGDSMKMFWFFTSSGTIPPAFKLCGMFQACCDSFLGVQYLMYGEGPVDVVKDHVLEPYSGDPTGTRLARVSSREYNAQPLPTGRFTPTIET
ncbi:related to PQ loop repeat protein [Cephalotrichum gorgonifer]|uniref:Related to PQ loop repeat protein n=1 Tax=Cephalotrichum gorgonifer TaxID=2041049 RepID=A0AAE8MV75_9PEZI|nr:related to PQ loop repeat protein [Cephalotrichum gorgonifer]